MFNIDPNDLLIWMWSLDWPSPINWMAYYGMMAAFWGCGYPCIVWFPWLEMELHLPASNNLWIEAWRVFKWWVF